MAIQHQYSLNHCLEARWMLQEVRQRHQCREENVHRRKRIENRKVPAEQALNQTLHFAPTSANHEIEKLGRPTRVSAGAVHVVNINTLIAIVISIAPSTTTISHLSHNQLHVVPDLDSTTHID